MCSFQSRQIFSCLIIVVILELGKTVKITELKVPTIARHGNGAVVLDCDYTLEDSVDQSGLVVKWFFNDRLQPVYQWIPGNRKPQSLGILKGKLNLDYKASNDENTMHRALHILQPSVELSGEYTCVVSTFHNEDKQTKKMLVFVSERNLQLKQETSPEGDLRLVCSAEGVYPRPDLVIRLEHNDLVETKISQREIDGLFDISATVTLPDTVLDTPSAEFECELSIPEANYTVRREYVYIPGSGSSKISTIPWMLLITTFLMF